MYHSLRVSVESLFLFFDFSHTSSKKGTTLKLLNVLCMTGAIVVLSVFTACSGVPPVDSDPLPTQQAQTDEPTITAPPEPPIVTVATPWTPGSFQKGIQIYWHSNGEPITSVKKRASSILDYVVSTGANSVGITFPIYTDGPNPTKLYNGQETPTVEELSAVISAAKQRDLRVLVRPAIDETNIMTFEDEWRGSISPQNLDDWFSSYTALMLPYLEMATLNNVDEFSIGVELTSLEAAPQWASVETVAHAAFSGTISYAMNWSEYGTTVPIGQMAVDAYPSINLPDSASVDQLVGAWNQYLARQPVEQRRSISLQEVGIPAESGKYPRPWSWGDDTTLNLDVQTNWFTASCQAAKASEMAGMYFWMIDSNIDFSTLNPQTDPVGNFVGRPAEQAMKECFK
jgi:hypothetical protein